MENIIGRHQPKNVPLPKSGTAARYVVDQWQQAGEILWADAEGIYMFRLRQKNPGKQRRFCTYNLVRLLKKYGFKEGKSGDRSPWVFGNRYPTPGTFWPPVQPPKVQMNVTTLSDAPKVKPGLLEELQALPTKVPFFTVGDLVTCNKIGRAVVAEVVEQTKDNWFKIKWPNGLTDQVPYDLLQLVSPAEKCIDPVCPPAEQEEYKSEKTKRLERELEESSKADKLKAWAKQAVLLMQSEWSAEQMFAICEELEAPQFVDPADEHLYDDE